MIANKEIDVYIKTSALFGDNVKNVFDEAIYRAFTMKNGGVGEFNKDDVSKKEDLPMEEVPEKRGCL